MAFPNSSKKAPNVFLEVTDLTGSPVVKSSSGTSYGPVIVNPAPPPPPPPPPSLLCSSFVYIFSQFVPLSPGLLLGWPSLHLWYFRVYQNPVTNLNLGPATLVTIDASVVLTVSDFIASVESQLPGFSVIIDNQNLVVSRSGSVFALADGDGTEYPTPGYDYGIWDYKAFYDYTDNDSYPDSSFSQILNLGVCYPLPPAPPEIRWLQPPFDSNGTLDFSNPTDIEVTF